MGIPELWLCDYSDTAITYPVPKYLLPLWKLNWTEIFNNPLISEILTTYPKIKNFNNEDLETAEPENALQLAACCLQAFVQENFLGPTLNTEEYNEISKQLKKRDDLDFMTELSVDGTEINKNTSRPELLVLAKIILDKLTLKLTEEYDSDFLDQLTFPLKLWYLRFLYIHQQILDEPVQALYKKFNETANELMDMKDKRIFGLHVNTKIFILLEICQGYSFYKRIWRIEPILNLTKEFLKVHLEIKGVLGRRTKHQEKAVPQLMLKVLPSDSSGEGYNEELVVGSEMNKKRTILPQLLKLDDDVRLEKITFEKDEDNQQLEVPSLSQQFILAVLQYTIHSQPKDNLTDEELTPFLSTLLFQTYGSWSCRITTLLLNIQKESNHRRTVERSLKQCEEIVNLINNSDTSHRQRLSMAYSSYIQPKWMVKARLGNLMISLGMIKSALDLYLKLHCWEDVINCYNLLDMRNKAAEIIQQEIDKKPTVELYCLLGDATDNVDCYKAAWELSNERSGRAQRHWGCYYFTRKNYTEAILHLQKSIELNALQEIVWARIGYAALSLENWKLAANAYRRYTTIEPDGFESWNNLAKAYINMGDKVRAHKVLKEALKCNFNNWKVWENFLLCSIDTGELDDAINAYNQLIVLKGKYYDQQILEILCKSVTKRNDTDSNSNDDSKLRLLKKIQTLIGQLCVQNAHESGIFELAALIHKREPLIQAQQMQKAYRAYTQQQINWSKDPQSCMKVLKLCQEICEFSLKAWTKHTETNRNGCLSQLSSARLTAQGAIRVATVEQWDQCSEILNLLQPILDKIIEILSNK